MRQRIAFGSIAVAAMLAVVVLWGATKPTSAIAEMAENIRRAKSWKATMICESGRPQEPTPALKLTSTFYWLSPGSIRMDTDGGPGKTGTEIYPRDTHGIDIDHGNKKFRRQSSRGGEIPPLIILDKLGAYSGQADRDLGQREIDGKIAHGFSIAMHKIDPDTQSGQAEIWIDTKSNLPALLRYEFKDAGQPAILTFRDFQWNIDLDLKLFDPTPPVGYADATPEPPTLAEQVARITKGLEIYRELSGGHYPRGKIVYGDVTRDEMFAMIGIQGKPTSEQMQSEKYGMVMQAGLGLGTLNGVLRDNSDAAYHGKTVGPKDAERILLRWKLEGGRYQVIYGDLRDEILPLEQVRTLEGK